MAYIVSFIHAVMRWGLISDIHANAPALRAVLEDLDRHNVDRVLCAGDVVGYYPFPNETIDIMVKRRAISIQGNHDRAVLNVDPSMMNPEASDAVMWTASQISDRSRRYLASLPPNTAVRSGKVFIRVFHGSPRDPIEYVYEDDVTEGLLLMARCSMLVMGHTHIPYVRRFPSGLIVNPGSVGQPRDGDPRASYSIVDTEEGVVENHRVEYDLDAMARRFEGTSLPRWLLDRLNNGI